MAIATMKVPTVFTAVDRFSDVVSRMTGGVNKFSKTASSAVNRVDNKINRMWDSMNGMSQLAIGGGIGGLFYYAGKDIKDYEVKINSLAAVTGTKIGSMNEQIEALGKRTKMSVIDVAGAFEIVGSKMSQYLQDPKALQSITDASITLSRAARMELEPAISSLTGVMNIYRMSSEQAGKVVNKLSAGETVGSISIAQTADILTQFGAQAVRANAPIEESIALIQTLVKSMGVEGVGRGLRNILFDISSTETWDKNRWKAIRMAGVDFKFVTNNAEDLTARLRELKKLSGVKGAMELFFKRTGTVAANTLFQNFDKQGFTDFLAKIEVINDASDKAAKNTFTLSSMIDKLKASFTNFIVTGDNANGTLGITKSLIGWMTDNMGTLLNLVQSVVLAFVGWKTIVGIIGLVTGVQGTYNAVMKAHLIITQIATYRAITYSKALRMVAVAQWTAYWPALLIIGALGLLAYAFWDTGDKTEKMANKQVSALDKGNAAWRNSTKIQAQEMAKQRNLMKTPKAPITKERTKMEQILRAEEKRKAFSNINSVGKDMSGKVILPKINNDIAKRLFENSQMEAVLGKEKATTLRNSGFTFAEFKKVYPNVAGFENRSNLDKKGQIVITLKGSTDEVSSITGSEQFDLSGVKVKTTSTKKSSNEWYDIF
jgi:TP901 family phage tail tape measure protein